MEVRVLQKYITIVPLCFAVVVQIGLAVTESVAWYADWILLFIAFWLGLAYFFDKIYAKKELSQNKVVREDWKEYTIDQAILVLALTFCKFFLIDLVFIPTGSLAPTVKPDSYVLANKFSYGLRNPITGKYFVVGEEISRGDVVVFNKPITSEKYAKRVVGLPNDEIYYNFKKNEFKINGVRINKKIYGTQLQEVSNTNLINAHLYKENLLGVEHDIQEYGELDRSLIVEPRKAPNGCKLIDENKSIAITCKVPADNYFVMGDNRDNSEDSRFWGFVPRDNFTGKVIQIF